MCVCVCERVGLLQVDDKRRAQVSMRLEFFVTFLLVHNQVLVATASSSSEEDDGSNHDEDNDKSSSKYHDWGYGDQEGWPSAFHHCSGKSQSPIDIETGKATYDPHLSPIELDGYDLTAHPPLKLQNNGHTLKLNLPKTMRIVKGFDQVYLAAQLHFHWGTVAVSGSEHTVDNVHFPAEIHVVHYNSKYADISEAASKPDGLAVLGGFIGIGLHENEHYEKILSALNDVSTEESDVDIPGFNVRPLLPNNLNKFYRYDGSLTTPPCFQTVNWTLFNETIMVSRKQLATLEDTLKTGHKLMSKNFRATQLLHGRRVLASFSTSPSVTTDPSEIKPRVGPREGMSRGILWVSQILCYIIFQVMSLNAAFQPTGDTLAIAFGALFIVSLLAFSVYACLQRKACSKSKKDSRQSVIYKPATKDDV